MTGLEIGLTAAGLFTGMLLFTAAGRKTGRFRAQVYKETPGAHFAVLEGGVFGLMGLLIALTFSASATRLENRRQVLVDETNAIGTAWLRIALLPVPTQDAMRQQFRRYVDTRLAFFHNTTDLEASRRTLARTNALQGEIWSQGVIASGQTSNVAAATLFLPALNAMIDITTTGTMLAKTHIPLLIRALLVISPLLCAFLAGIESSPRARGVWIPSILFAIMLSLTVYGVLDLDYPRVGLIRVDAFDQAMEELRVSMGNGE